MGRLFITTVEKDHKKGQYKYTTQLETEDVF